jgi:hypothetical protein
MRRGRGGSGRREREREALFLPPLKIPLLLFLSALSLSLLAGARAARAHLECVRMRARRGGGAQDLGGLALFLPPLAKRSCSKKASFSRENAELWWW